MIATSHSWLDRVACHRLGICGGLNWLLSTWLFQSKRRPSSKNREHHHEADWVDSAANLKNGGFVNAQSRAIPSFVFDHAPLIWLHDDEKWWPTDVADFLHHVEHVHTGSAGRSSAILPNMEAVLQRQQRPGESFFESLDDPEAFPDWLTSYHNAPRRAVGSHKRIVHGVQGHVLQGLENISPLSHRLQGSFESSEYQDSWSPSQDHLQILDLKTSVLADKLIGNMSGAPAFLITVSKANETLDAFWFFFYGFNRGARVTGIQYGNHVGDWEHVLIRFDHGKPREAFLSAHEWGSAYRFDVLEKSPADSQRPVIYAGLGSHAHYASPGKHAYALPFGLLGDECSQGHLWDPALNLLSYVHYPQTPGSSQKPQFLASLNNPQARTSWLEYTGRWGDRKYSLGDKKGRNYRFAGEYKYLDGPTGPWDKSLNRDHICEHANKPCIIRENLGGYVGPIKGFRDVENAAPQRVE